MEMRVSLEGERGWGRQQGGRGNCELYPPIARVAAATDKLLLSTPCGTPSYYATPACGKHPLPLRCSVSLVSCFGQIYKLRLAWNTNCIDRGSVRVCVRERVCVCASKCVRVSVFICGAAGKWNVYESVRQWLPPSCREDSAAPASLSSPSLLHLLLIPPPPLATWNDLLVLNLIFTFICLG